MSKPITCPWCSALFTPRQTGGRRQKFCSPACRRALDRALRAWAGQELAEGRVTVPLLQRARCAEAVAGAD
jgi:hypothetical protein